MTLDDSIQSWDWRGAVDRARNRLISEGWPVPTKPIGRVSDLIFPTDVESLTSIALGNLRLRYAGWYSYATASLSFAKAELTAFSEVFEAMLGQRMYKLSKTMDGRAVKDVLRGISLQKDDVLGAMFEQKLNLTQRVQTLEGLVSGLDIQTRGIESEQIRRATARKIEMGGM